MGRHTGMRPIMLPPEDAENIGYSEGQCFAFKGLIRLLRLTETESDGVRELLHHGEWIAVSDSDCVRLV